MENLLVNYKAQALDTFNRRCQPAWAKFLKYEELDSIQLAVVDRLAYLLELDDLMECLGLTFEYGKAGSDKTQP